MKFTVFSRFDGYSRKLKADLEQIILEDLHWILDADHPDLCICIGGDGTILRAIQKYKEQLDHLVFTAIHTGTLGFFTDYTKDEIDSFLADLRELDQNGSVIEKYPMIEACLSDGRIFRGLNEIRIGSFLSTVRFDVLIDGEFFETTNSCGICVSTQAGSSGANRSLGGAVVENGLDVLEITQIMPVSHANHHSFVSPYIMNKNRVVTLKGKSLEESILCCDYFETPKLTDIDWVEIRLSVQSVRFARLRPYSYLKRLRNLF